MIRLSAVAPLALAALGLLAACGSPPPPPSLASADQAIQTAQNENAAALAPQAMAAAKERQARAHQAMALDRPYTADRLAQEALVNAQLAQARVDQGTAQQALANTGRPAAPAVQQGELQ